MVCEAAHAEKYVLKSRDRLIGYALSELYISTVEINIIARTILQFTREPYRLCMSKCSRKLKFPVLLTVDRVKLSRKVVFPLGRLQGLYLPGWHSDMTWGSRFGVFTSNILTIYFHQEHHIHVSSS